MKISDQQKAQKINTIPYPSRTIGEFRQAVYRLMARKDGGKNLSKYEKATTFFEEGNAPCNHPKAIIATGIHQDKKISRLICKICAV